MRTREHRCARERHAVVVPHASRVSVHSGPTVIAATKVNGSSERSIVTV
jgi:hypothetical protein